MSHTSLPEEITTAPTPEETAIRLGRFLNLDAPAPLPAARRVRTDAAFAKAVFTARKMPALLNQMMVAPETARIAPEPGDTTGIMAATEHQSTQSSVKIAAKGAAALLQWGMDGLKQASPWQIEARLSACNACPHKKPAPKTLIYRGTEFVTGADSTICGLCDCLINTKAAMATSHCPDKDPDTPTLSRWQDPWVKDAKDPDGVWT